MSFPTARENFLNKNGLEFLPVSYVSKYIHTLEQQNEKMLDALCGIHDEVIGIARHQDWHSDVFRQKFQAMQAAIESATGLPVDMAIKRWEEGK